MRTHDKQPERQSRTLDANPKASRQASWDVILQKYNQHPIQRKVLTSDTTRYITEEEFIDQIGIEYNQERLREVFDSKKIILYMEAMDYVTGESDLYDDYPEFVPATQYNRSAAERANFVPFCNRLIINLSNYRKS